MTARLFRSSRPFPVLLFAMAAAAIAYVLPLSARQGPTTSLFVSVMDESGKPVKDIQLGELLIREDNTDREVIAVKPASQPISVAVLVDTAQGRRVTDAYGTPEEYTRDIRTSIAGFARQILNQSPDASVSLTEFGGAAIPVVSFTQNFAEFEKGVNRLTAKPGVGSVMMEALVQANKELAERPSTRRAIVSLNLEPSEEQSREDPKKVVNAFKDSAAQLWSLSIQRGGLKNSRRDLVLNDFAKATGGQRDFIVGISAAENILKSYADALTYQYEIVYKRPEAKTPKTIQVGLARSGKFKIHASGFPPK